MVRCLSRRVTWTFPWLWASHERGDRAMVWRHGDGSLESSAGTEPSNGPEVRRSRSRWRVVWSRRGCTMRCLPRRVTWVFPWSWASRDRGDRAMGMGE